MDFYLWIVAGKKTVFNNVKHNQSCEKCGELPHTTTNAGLHSKKVGLLIWWGWKGVVFHNHLPEDWSNVTEWSTRSIQYSVINGTVFLLWPCHCFVDTAEVTGAWLRSLATPSIFAQPCTIRFLPVLVSWKLIEGTDLQSWKGCNLVEFFTSKDKKFIE